MDLELKGWLKEKAGLSGTKLSLAINACFEGAVDSVNDLLELYEIDKLREVFPQGMIRAKVDIALERDKDTIKAQDTTTNEKESPKVSIVSSSSAAIPQTEQQMQPQGSANKHTDQAVLQLPPNKLYHFFASHKVRSSFRVVCLCLGGFVCVILLLIQKMHSVHGSISEAIARAAKDWLEIARGLRGFLDVR